MRRRSISVDMVRKSLLVQDPVQQENAPEQSKPVTRRSMAPLLSALENKPNTRRSVAPQMPIEEEKPKPARKSRVPPASAKISRDRDIENIQEELASVTVSTPSTRSRKSIKPPQTANPSWNTTTDDSHATKKLLPRPSQIAPKTCPRNLRQTPSRKASLVNRDVEAKIRSVSSSSSDDSPLCYLTPKKNGKSLVNNSDSKIETTSTKTPSRKSTRISIAPKPEPSIKRTTKGRKTISSASSKSPMSDDASEPVKKPQRKGKSLLKTGNKGKAVKAKRMPSWSSDLDSCGTPISDPIEEGTVLSQALSRLHVSKEAVSRKIDASSTNWSPLGRENEANEIYSFISEHLNANTSGSLFVAGVPGIGKSATIGAVLQRLQALSNSKAGDLPKFRMVNVNGFHFGTAVRFYCEVHRQIFRPNTGKTGSKKVGLSSKVQKQKALGPKAALEALNAHFTGKTSNNTPTVLVVDELDALVSASSANQVAFGQSGAGNTARKTANFGANRVLYNLLEWASTPVSRLVIVAVANTLDLPERALPLRVVSRLGLHRLAFMPYTHVQLCSIVQSRLAGLPGQVFDSNDAILLAARKVAMASGDARRILELW